MRQKMGMVKDFISAAKKRPPANFGAAVLLSLALSGYTVHVGISGGFVNPNQPQSYGDVIGDVVDHLAARQTIEDLMERARQPPRRINTFFGSYTPDEYFFAKIPEAMAEHRAIEEGTRTIRQGWSHKLEDFLGTELRELPEQARVSVSGVRPRTILFNPGKQYELLCTSTVGAQRTYEDYLRALVANRWLAEELRYDEGGKQGYIVAQARGMTLTICVSEYHVQEDARTTILWELEIDDLNRNRGGSSASRWEGGGDSEFTPLDGSSRSPRAPGNKRGPH
ncbi:MAG: hypothetical protein JJU11_14285 [Candidatus Sumerlaeia bacterium]|nr:hypothetical protein [Candidatus Sumerlaeia bacterium]